MKPPPHILLVCSDPALMQVRKLVLGTYFDVRTAGRVSEAAEILSGQDVELMVLCETLSNDDRSRLVRLVEEAHSRVLLLSLLRPEANHQEAVLEQPLAVTRGPLQLLKECADTLGVILSQNHRIHTPRPAPHEI
jgi:hypothetical protein